MLFPYRNFSQSSPGISETLQTKIRNRIRKRRPIIPGRRQRPLIPHQHILRPHRTQRINHQPIRPAINVEHLALTIHGTRRRRARRVVVVEEAVQTRAVDERVVRVEEAEAERVAVAGEAGGVVGVVDGCVAVVGAVGGVGVGLVVSGLLEALI